MTDVNWLFCHSHYRGRKTYHHPRQYRTTKQMMLNINVKSIVCVLNIWNTKRKKNSLFFSALANTLAHTHTHTVNAFVISIIKYNRIELYIIIYGDDGENCIVFPFPFRTTSECYSERRRNTKRTYPEDKGNNLCVYLMEIEKDFYLFIYVRFCFCVVLCSTSCMLLTLPFLFVVPCL